MVSESHGKSLFRMIGIMAICVSGIWALQILAFDDAASMLTRLVWVLGAATMAGAGVGMILASSSLPEAEGAKA